MPATRSQRYLDTALRHVEAVRDKTKPKEERRNIYGGLCYVFPVLVRTNGLCQALAFVAAKAGKDEQEPPPRAWAYQQLRDNIAEVLGIEGDPLAAVRDAGLFEYMRMTRTVLDAWDFYPRFADSVLEVELANAGEIAS
jgi:CRISPR-associated protein Cmr5